MNKKEVEDDWSTMQRLNDSLSNGGQDGLSREILDINFDSKTHSMGFAIDCFEITPENVIKNIIAAKKLITFDGCFAPSLRTCVRVVRINTLVQQADEAGAC